MPALAPGVTRYTTSFRGTRIRTAPNLTASIVKVAPVGLVIGATGAVTAPRTRPMARPRDHGSRSSRSAGSASSGPSSPPGCSGTPSETRVLHRCIAVAVEDVEGRAGHRRVHGGFHRHVHCRLLGPAGSRRRLGSGPPGRRPAACRTMAPTGRVALRAVRPPTGAAADAGTGSCAPDGGAAGRSRIGSFGTYDPAGGSVTSSIRSRTEVIVARSSSKSP